MKKFILLFLVIPFSIFASTSLVGTWKGVMHYDNTQGTLSMIVTKDHMFQGKFFYQEKKDDSYIPVFGKLEKHHKFDLGIGVYEVKDGLYFVMLGDMIMHGQVGPQKLEFSANLKKSD